MLLHFPWSGVAELLDEVRRGNNTEPTLSGETAKGLWLVGDHGVYLMANTTDGPREKARNEKELRFVVYADECNPDKLPFDAWSEAKQVSFGGDDGCDLIPLADIDRLLRGHAGKIPAALTIAFHADSFRVELTFDTAGQA